MGIINCFSRSCDTRTDCKMLIIMNIATGSEYCDRVRILRQGHSGSRGPLDRGGKMKWKEIGSLT